MLTPPCTLSPLATTFTQSAILRDLWHDVAAGRWDLIDCEGETYCETRDADGDRSALLTPETVEWMVREFGGST